MIFFLRENKEIKPKQGLTKGKCNNMTVISMQITHAKENQT